MGSTGWPLPWAWSLILFAAMREGQMMVQQAASCQSHHPLPLLS